MKRIIQLFCFSIFFVCVFTACAVYAEQQTGENDKKEEKLRTIALITFETMPGDIKENQWIGAGFAESVSVKIAAAEYPLLSVYERRKLNLTLKNAGISQTGMSYSSPAAVEKIAKAVNSAGVDLLLMGSFQFTGLWNEKDAHYEFNGSVIDTATGKMLPGMALSLSGRVDSTGKELFDAHSNMARLIIKSLGIEVASAKKISYLYDPLTDSLAAYREYILGLESKDRGEFEDAIKHFSSASTISDSFNKALLAKGETYEEMYKATEKGSKKEVGEKWEKDSRNDVALTGPAYATSLYNLAKSLIAICKNDENDKSKCNEAIIQLDKFNMVNENKVLFWKFKHGKYLLGQPVEKDGIIYFNSCTDGNSSWVAKTTVQDCKNASLYAIDVNTGKLLWNKEFKGLISSSILVFKDEIYTSSCQQLEVNFNIPMCIKATLFGFNRFSGNFIRKYTARMTMFNEIYSTDKILFIRTSNQLEIINKESGDKLSDPFVGLSIPRLYFDDSDIYVYGFGMAKKANGGYWNFDKTFISKIDKSTGNELWRIVHEDATLTSPYFDDINFFVFTGSVDNGSNNETVVSNLRLRSYDKKTGEEIWTHKFKGDMGGMYKFEIDSTGNGLYFLDASNKILYRVNKIDGKTIWEKTVDQSTYTFYTHREDYNIFYSVSGENNKLIAISKQTGKEEWTYDLKKDRIENIYMEKGNDLFLSILGGYVFICLEKSSGNEKWRTNDNINRIVFTDEIIFAYIEATNIYSNHNDWPVIAYDRKTGRKLWTYGMPISPTKNRFYAFGDKLFVYDDTVYALGLQPGSRGPIDLDADLLRTEALFYLGDYETGKRVLMDMIHKKPNNEIAWLKIIDVCEKLNDYPCLFWARPKYFNKYLRPKEINETYSEHRNNIVNLWSNQLPLKWFSSKNYYEMTYSYFSNKRFRFKILVEDSVIRTLDMKSGLLSGSTKIEKKSGSIPNKNVDIIYVKLQGLIMAISDDSTCYWSKEIETDYISGKPFIVLDNFLMTRSSDVVKVIDKRDGTIVSEYSYNEIGELSKIAPIGDNFIGYSIVNNNKVNVIAFSAMNGNKIWKRELQDNWGTFVVCGDILLVGESSNVLTAIDINSGKDLWKYKSKKSDDGLRGMTCDLQRNTIYVGGNGYMYKIDLATGSEIWKSRVEGEIWRDILYDESGLFAFTNEYNLYSINANTGKSNWNVKIDGNLWKMISQDKYLILETDDYRLIVFNIVTGEKIWSLQMFDISYLKIFENSLIINNVGQVFSIDLKKAEQMAAEGKRWWMD